MKKLIKDSNSYIIKPVTLGFLLLVYTINLFIAEREIYLIMLIAGVITLFVIAKEKLVKVIASFFLILALAYLMNKYCEILGWLGSIYTMIIIMLRIFPVWLLAISLSTYNTPALMNSLRNLGISNNLAIAVAVFFRFLPDYKEYMKDIRESLKVRNIAFKWNNPLESFELYLVPMIYKAFQTGEILTCSSITKGIECKCKKTSYDDLRLTSLDYLFILFGICILVVSIWQKF
ncbi:MULTISPECIES: energy-coupling factor transporter transmembrane component T family protein [Enterococcus]|uniref:energy-coupling factor transporter transmembrane component T family protein n=1 Tax=Enterococcus TaxID=1350 RepID=UPI001165731B|nr:energy-coupling factor transporter transmembrane component T [Enterococcus avium]HAP3021760.1 energy-coupling factor transporter transmembrane protein EcfT [Enterococcus faecalis]AYQ24145.1 ABC transporter permease [Enterococcus avium]HBI1562648.1 energy-coupling factor transporter transmembrane protein EcfT [Enterococcus faecalis]HBI1565788.1 energy-coupling factor transporter transmembrane protein EcfT [Enterococcus faecalis]HBI1718059.1 energy-coupling factor transporter transmembrane pr